LQIEISLPATYIFDFKFTDVVLTEGDVTVSQFPTTTTNEFSQGLAGSIKIPSYDASDLYLPFILTPSGIIFDNSKISSLVFKSTETLNVGELWANGSQYDSEHYSSDGIPFSRLAAKYANFTGENLYQYGNGINFLTASRSSNEVHLKCNSAGVVSHAEDYNTGFSFSTIQEGDSTHNYEVKITCLAGSSVVAGTYFFFYDLSGNKYYVWYIVDGTGVDPSPAGYKAGISVSVSSSTSDAPTVAHFTAGRINARYFAVPDYRGSFLRVWNQGGAGDPDALTRTSGYSGTCVLAGDHVGTYQSSQNLAHYHTYLSILGGSAVLSSGDPHDPNPDAATNTSSSGGSESRPINKYVGVAILY
jgi:hypothetical protein